MTETKTKFEQEHENEIQRIVAVIHLNELASKNHFIQDWLIDFYKVVLEFANNNGIKSSKINSNDILNTLHNRTNGSIHNGGNGIMGNI